MSKNTLKRTSLYASGSSAGKVLEARFYNQDCIVYDLEDSVSPGYCPVLVFYFVPEGAQALCGS